jgi:signal-induced proliferation-associated 1 like protein 3
MLPLAPVVLEPVLGLLDSMGAPAPLVPVSRLVLPGVAPVLAPVPIVPVPVLLLPVLPVLPLPAPRVPVFVPGVTPEGAGSALTLSSPGYVVLLWASTTPHVKVMARLANRMRKRGE